jgi:NAD(P)-dependent dehydrogenase (short-subunit alcohol dehydrogenase family)
LELQRFTGSTVIVSGGASGIGKATCTAFAEEGARVIVLDLDGERASIVANDIKERGGSATAHAVDLRCADEVTSIFEQIDQDEDHIEALCCCAFSMAPGAAAEVPLEGWYDTIDSCLNTAYLSSRLALPRMLSTGSGSIVMIASTCGIRAEYGLAAYDTSKAALIGLTRSIAVDYADRGIRCNCICPGAVRTPATESMFSGDDHALRAAGDRLLRSHPTGRICQPEEVAGLVLYLCSDLASSINGAVLPLDGGQTAQLGGLSRPQPVE